MNKYQQELEKLIEDKYRLHGEALEREYEALRNKVMIDLNDYMMQQDAIGINYSDMMQYERLKGLLGQIDAEIGRVDFETYKNISDYASITGGMAYNELFYDFERQTGQEVSFNLLPKETLETIVNMNVDGLKLSQRLTDGNMAKLKGNMIATLFEGFGGGYSYQKMAKRLSDLSKASFKRSMTIMRTEGGRVQSIAHERSQLLAEEKGVEFDKIWSATLDGDTRGSHRRLDGKKADADGYFHINGLKAKQPHLFGVAKEDINCRCRTFAKLRLPRHIERMNPMTRRDNETGEIIKYNDYEGWMKSKGFDIDGNPLKEKSNIKLATNMLESIGQNNYDKFHTSLNALPAGPVKDMIAKFGNEIRFEKMGKRKGNFASGINVNLNQLAFDGQSHKTPLETVYHEIGHAIDALGRSKVFGKEPIKTGTTVKRKVLGKMRTIDEYVTHLSGHPDYNLKQTIRDDLWKFINGDLKTLDSLGKRPRKKLEKEIYDKERSEIYRQSQENLSLFIKDMRSKHTVKELAALSDMLESTGWNGTDYPLGAGHGKAYWRNSGNAETEFFAHATEIVVNEKAGAIFKEAFPNSLKIYEQMIKDMMKGG